MYNNLPYGSDSVRECKWYLTEQMFDLHCINLANSLENVPFVCEMYYNSTTLTAAVMPL